MPRKTTVDPAKLNGLTKAYGDRVNSMLDLQTRIARIDGQAAAERASLNKIQDECDNLADQLAALFEGNTAAPAGTTADGGTLVTTGLDNTPPTPQPMGTTPIDSKSGGIPFVEPTIPTTDAAGNVVNAAPIAMPAAPPPQPAGVGPSGQPLPRGAPTGAPAPTPTAPVIAAPPQPSTEAPPPPHSQP